MGSISRGDRSERFSQEFNDRAAVTALGTVGDTFTLEAVYLETSELNEEVRLYYRLRSATGHAMLLTEDSIVFDPDRDEQFEFGSIARSLGYDDDKPEDVAELTRRLKAADLVGPDFTYDPARAT